MMGVCMSENWDGKKCNVCEKVYSIFQSGWTYHKFDNLITCSDDCKKEYRDKRTSH